MVWIQAPVMTTRGPAFIDLVARKTQRFAPISDRFADIISDPDSITAVFTAWEAAYERWGAVVAQISIDLSNDSFYWLEAHCWTVRGDSLGLAAHLCILTHFRDDFDGYNVIIASGAIDSTPKGYKVRIVDKISEKVAVVLDNYAGKRIALVLPKAHRRSVSDMSRHLDLWLAGRELGDFQPHRSSMQSR